MFFAGRPDTWAISASPFIPRDSSRSASDGRASLDRNDEDRGALHQVELCPGDIKEGAAGNDGYGIHARLAGYAAQAVKTKY